MKLGGNASWKDWLVRHPGSASQSDNVKDKYSSQAAVKYREELARRVALDEQHFGKGKVYVDGMGAPKDEPAKAEDNFFDTWDAPQQAKPALIPPPQTGNLISFGSRGGTPIGSRSASPALSSTGSTPAPTSAPAAAAPTAPRTVTSSSLRTTTSGGVPVRAKPSLGSRAPSATSAGGAPAPRVSKLGGKLGGVKRGGTVNFEEAERKAKEEEERIKQLGYDSKKEQEAAAAQAQARAAAAASTSAARGPAVKKDSDTERLGMGFKRLGFGQVSGMSGEASAAEAAKAAKAAQRRANGYEDEVLDETDYARKTFGTQKGISSDQYHQTGAYDANSAREAQSRLQSFNGASAISSNQYFGRSEQEEDELEDSIMSANGLSGLERGVQDVVRAAMEATGVEDLDSLQSSIRNGALKLSDMLARYA